MTDLPEGPVELELDGVTHDGEGVGRFVPEEGEARGRGKAVFVPGGIPGERVRVRIVDDRRSWARAELVEILEPSDDRVDPPCPYAPGPGRPDPRCGGCQLQHVTIGRQREMKERIVREQLERLGKLDDPPVAALRAPGLPFGYRNHIQLHRDPEGRLGFHAAGTHDVVPIDHCPISDDRIDDLLAGLDEEPGGPDPVVVRAHPETGTEAVMAGGDGRDRELAAKVGRFTYRFDASCFFQVNTAGAELLVEETLEAADGTSDLTGQVVWDLFAGVGLFAIPLAAAGATVTAVESHRSAAGWAGFNAETTGVALEVVHEDARSFTTRAPGPVPDVVVVDPPRAGAGQELVARLAALDVPRIVYVACDVPALARDTQVLTNAGYELVLAVPVDMFPQTYHLEVVATFVAQE